jgi:hypothetical protein
MEKMDLGYCCPGNHTCAIKCDILGFLGFSRPRGQTCFLHSGDQRVIDISAGFRGSAFCAGGCNAWQMDNEACYLPINLETDNNQSDRRRCDLLPCDFGSGAVVFVVYVWDLLWAMVRVI